MNTTLNLLKLE